MNKQNINDWLSDHGDYLYRFALARLRDFHLAQDVVQETFLAAIKSPSFAGPSSARTWLTGILKHKIIDLMRKKNRETVVSDLIEESENYSADDFFDAAGHWIDKPQEWGMPEDALEQKQFLSVLQSCIEKLPPKLANLFTLRDVHETDNDEICKELNITPTNAWVMLYRARMGLRKCLEINWMGV